MTEEVTKLTVDQKLDMIMEAVSFQAKLLTSALIAFDKKLQLSSQTESKLIKPNGLI